MLETLPLEILRKRTSEKWTTYPPDVLPAFVAETDFGVPPAVAQALNAAMASGDFGYASPGELGEVFADFAARRFGWNTVDPKAVFAAADVMSAIEQILILKTEPGDGVAINPPVYPPFFEVIEFAGRE